MLNWLQFIKERFKPVEYIPLIFLFSAVNYLFLEKDIFNLTYLKIFLITLSFFLRMRLFDEIKDYEVDLKINPARPLPRGLLTIQQVKNMIFILFIFEASLMVTFSETKIFYYCFAALYSILMYKEFFIGNLLRPHLTTYAITHTIVVSFLSLVMMPSITDNVLLFSFSHWFIFNLFEFSRKTFSISEERIDVLSYSNIFTVRGAYTLSLSQVLIGFYILVAIFGLQQILPLAGVVVSYSCISLIGIIKPTIIKPKFFRLISTLYLALHFVTLFYALWRHL